MWISAVCVRVRVSDFILQNVRSSLYVSVRSCTSSFILIEERGGGEQSQVTYLYRAQLKQSDRVMQGILSAGGASDTTTTYIHDLRNNILTPSIVLIRRVQYNNTFL